MVTKNRLKAVRPHIFLSFLLILPKTSNVVRPRHILRRPIVETLVKMDPNLIKSQLILRNGRE